ncbi:hypothetical protein PG993_015018 [Apiospora rasikravindrae]|uniref:Tat pathway signal sequence n=1 Tax=Apiospora rasikravindrae TaxID=990691 RepID=A0ABR1RPD9_9PEZI
MFGHPKSKEYRAVEDEEAADLSETESDENLLHKSQGQARRPPPPWIPRVCCNAAGSVLLAVFTAVTVLVTIQCTIWYERRGSNAPRYRPAFCDTAVRYDRYPLHHQVRRPLPRPQRLGPEPHLPPPPSPEVDAVWTRIATADGVYPISAADVSRLGKDPSYAVDAPAAWNFPPDKPKLMGLEAFHLLHCLNAVRKGLVTTYDYYWGARGYGFAPPAVFARHLDHCVDVLRQHLMCHADLEPFVFNWRVGQEKPYADFAVRKTCVDFEYLLEWAEEHKDPRHTELWKSIQKPEGVLEREAPAGLPQITNDTIWDKSGHFPVANLTGLGGKEYCLSPAS